MTLNQVLMDQDYSHRTQISLSKSMYGKLKEEKGELSLAALIRKIILEHWQQEEQQMKQKKQAKQVLVKGLTGNSPSREELVEWQRQLRRDKE